MLIKRVNTNLDGFLIAMNQLMFCKLFIMSGIQILLLKIIDKTIIIRTKHFSTHKIEGLECTVINNSIVLKTFYND